MKKVVILIIIILLLCSSLVAAGFWDKLTGNFKISDLFISTDNILTADLSEATIKENVLTPVEPELTNGCGDGSCDRWGTGENSLNCPVDCPAVCGDNVCTSSETSADCPYDCGTPTPANDCGDGTCDRKGVGENALNCPVDCPDVCGDNVCTGSENAASCYYDCSDICGDNVCTGSETSANCAQDCPVAPVIDFSQCEVVLRDVTETGDYVCNALTKTCVFSLKTESQGNKFRTYMMNCTETGGLQGDTTLCC